MYDYFVQFNHHQFTAHKMVNGEGMCAIPQVMLTRTLNLGIQLKLQWNIASVSIYLRNFKVYFFLSSVFYINILICYIVKQTRDESDIKLVPCYDNSCFCVLKGLAS